MATIWKVTGLQRHVTNGQSSTFSATSDSVGAASCDLLSAGSGWPRSEIIHIRAGGQRSEKSAVRLRLANGGWMAPSLTQHHKMGLADNSRAVPPLKSNLTPTPLTIRRCLTVPSEKLNLPAIIFVGLIVPIMLALFDHWLLSREFNPEREVASTQAMAWFVIQVGLLGVLCAKLVEPWVAEMGHLRLVPAANGPQFRVVARAGNGQVTVTADSASSRSGASWERHGSFADQSDTSHHRCFSEVVHTARTGSSSLLYV